MEFLFLLLPLILLLVQGAAGEKGRGEMEESLCVLLSVETGNAARCRRRGGFCSFDGCVSQTKPIGRCSSVSLCCKR
ncbi:hypothetical protein EK904_000936 [Melospiza melodia maxima]|nr:hypothetical protein EK904_000936 [Melospiza melodia maxima]